MAYRGLELLVLRRLIDVRYPHVLVNLIKHIHCKRVALVQLEAIHNLPHRVRFLQHNIPDAFSSTTASTDVVGTL